MAFAEKRQHVVFTHTEKFDVANDHHVVRFRIEQRAVDHFFQTLPVTSGQELQTFFHPFRGIPQPFAGGIFSDGQQNVSDFLLHAFKLFSPYS